MKQNRYEIGQIYGLESWVGSQSETLHTTQISQNELLRISGQRQPKEVLATVKIPGNHEYHLSDDELVLLLDGISDPGNLGTILRTAEWFGVSNVIASLESAELFNPKVIQSSMGSIFRVNYHRADLNSVCAELTDGGFRILLADMSGSAIESTNFSGKTALVIGSESHGSQTVDLEFISDKIAIRSVGETESLNVAIACGIILHQITFRNKA
ncbi:RNA methyltransferase [Crocinitomix catalasitica]|nr:RNA methyltransferase [Crocinitomix catalasitica]